MSDAAPDLNFVTQLLRHVISEQATVKYQMRVLTAIAMRRENTLATLLTEVRAFEAQP